MLRAFATWLWVLRASQRSIFVCAGLILMWLHWLRENYYPGFHWGKWQHSIADGEVAPLTLVPTTPGCILQGQATCSGNSTQKHTGVSLNGVVVTGLCLKSRKVLQPAPFAKGVSFPGVVDLRILRFVRMGNYLQTNGRRQKSWNAGLGLLD